MTDLITVTDEQLAEAREAGCEECVKINGEWRNLRMCMVCGKVGCCDSSPNRHASRHYQETGHHVIRGIGIGDTWTFDFVTGKTEDAAYQ